MKKPTKKQTALLTFISDFTKAHNFSPSYREIMRAMHLSSVSAVAEHIDNCVAAGFLKRVPGTARSLEIIEKKSYRTTIKDLQAAIQELEKTNKTANAHTLGEAIIILTNLS